MLQRLKGGLNDERLLVDFYFSWNSFSIIILFHCYIVSRCIFGQKTQIEKKQFSIELWFYTNVVRELNIDYLFIYLIKSSN